MKLTQADFEKLVSDVEKEFDLFLAKAESEAKPEESLAKVDTSKEKAEVKKAEAKEESAEADDKKEDKKDDEDKHDYDDSDIEEMQKMYASMGKAERELHKSAIEKCGEVSITKSEQPKEEPLNTKSNDSEVLKKAEDAEKAAALAKSELEAKAKELETTKEENEKLKKHVEELVSAVNGYFTKKGPTRKAITSIETVKKSEVEDKKPSEKSLTKSEITKILNEKASDPSLSKADREAINKYYFNGGKNVEVVKHLLTQ
jgi:hypothetical protein